MNLRMFLTPTYLIIAYLLVINIYGFIVMGTDKLKAKSRNWRVPEKKMFAVAFLGGSLGVYIGMKVFHHKTLHNKFKYGIPALFLINIIFITYIALR